MAHRGRPVGVRDARRRRRWLVHPRALRDRRRQRRAPPLRRLPHMVPRRGRLPRSAHDAHGRVVAARPGERPRPVDVVRRRVRSARAVRHPRAVGVDVRRRAVGRRPVDLAAVHRRRHRLGRVDRAPGPPHPGELRRQAVDDRPLVRRDRRRTRRATAVGHDRGDRVHRPRPLPGRRSAHRPVGRDAATDIWGKPVVPQFEPLGHTPLLVHWPGRAAGDVDALTTNVDLNATIADVVRCRSGAPHPRPIDRAVAHRRGRPRFATGRSAACSATGCRSPTAGASTPGPPTPTTSRCRCGRTDGRRCRCRRRSPTSCVPEARRAGLARHDAGHRHPGDPPTVRPGRPAPVLGGWWRSPRRAPPVRRVERSDRVGEPRRRDERARHDRPAPCRRSPRSRLPTTIWRRLGLEPT